MKDQRDAVLAYLASRGRTASSVKVEDCAHVWNLSANRAKWNRCAKLKDENRGYSSPKTLCKAIRYYANA